jgi:hypothetical protein
MKNVQFLTSIPFSICKSNFLLGLGDADQLPQRKELTEFINDNNVVDIILADPTQQHQAVGLIVNHEYCSLDQLTSKIVKSSACAKEYFYLAVNKFYIYSTVDTLDDYSKDYDSQLIDYCCRIIDREFVLLKHTVRNDDTGTLGNFLHPVTTMFFQRYEQV